MKKIKVLIAGIAGASLGTEILKSLCACEYYEVYGCDISSLAYGLYEEGFAKTFRIDHSCYVEQVVSLCLRYDIKVVVPGAEEPTLLLSESQNILSQHGIILVANDPAIILICSNKIRCFRFLKEVGVEIPQFVSIDNIEELANIKYPCIVKPSTGSGGSSFVYLARNREEARIYVDYLIRHKQTPMVQEYITHEDGEFTVGTLMLGQKISSIALKRTFSNKLSVLQKSEQGLISTGYSQGLIDDFTQVRKTCEAIAMKLGSKGPLNIQGRVRNGVLIPFEINPRFSASGYLRTIAGFNEVDLFIRFLLSENPTFPTTIKPGYYLRSLSEKYICLENLK